MTVPYTFANQSGPVPASELDANFAAVGNNVATANTVLAHAQPNITSVGILTAVSTSGNIVATGNLTANNVIINTIVEPVVTNDLDVTGQVFVDWLDANANPLPGAGIVASTANIYDIGEISAPFANVYASYYYGNISQTTGTIGNAILAQAVLNNSQPNITTVGTLTSLTVSGNIVSGNSAVINLYASGVVSATGNVRGGNINTVGNVSSYGIAASGFAQLPTYTIANLRTITGSVGYVATLTNSNPIGVLTFWNGSSNVWSYVANSTPV